MSTLLIAILTAALCAGFSLAAVVFYFKRVIEPRLNQMLDERSEQLGHTIETRVQSGVEAGIRSGIGKAASADTIVRATRSATRSGASLVEDGLNVLLGTPRRDK